MNLKHIIMCTTMLLTLNTIPILQTTLPTKPLAITQGDSGISTCAMETQWYYRSYKNKLQMRLWSVTQGKWLTDWIDV